MGIVWVFAQLLNGSPPRQADFFKAPGLTAFNIKNDFVKPGRAEGINDFMRVMESSYGTTLFGFTGAPPLEIQLGDQLQLTKFIKKKKRDPK